MSTQLPPLNKFRLLADTLSSGSNSIYREDLNISTIILSAQISNLTEQDQTLTVKILKSGSLTPITLLKDATIPPNEAIAPFSGKIVLERYDELIFQTPSSSSLESVLSLLENAND
jgi:hypothetical protein